MITLSCGHKTENFFESIPVAVKDIYYDHLTHQVMQKIKFMEVCQHCYDMYLVNDLLLLTTEDEENYLLGNLT